MDSAANNNVDKKIENKWFMIHTYSGYEKKVKTDLDQKIDALGMRETVKRVIVPEEVSKELVRGKIKEVARKLFPGYVMLEMVATREETDNGITYKVDSDAWYIVRNTNGVTGFVGVGSDPIPMEDNEIKNIFKTIGYKDESKSGEEDSAVTKEIVKVDFEVGDYVKVLDGGFEGHEGKVSEIDFEHNKAKLLMELFGRMTSVEVEFKSLQKV
ncbi:MAG: transcription termination/antitermination protein NusG [Fusobacteriaceae bacterium]